MNQVQYQCGLRVSSFILNLSNNTTKVETIRREISKDLQAPTKCIALTKFQEEDLLCDDQILTLPIKLQAIILPVQRVQIQVVMGDGKYRDFQFDELDLMEDLQNQVKEFIETYPDHNQWKYALKFNDKQIDFIQQKKQTVCNYFQFQEQVKVDIIIKRNEIQLTILKDNKSNDLTFDCNKSLIQLKQQLDIKGDNIAFLLNGDKQEEFNDRLISQVLSHKDTLTIVQIVK